jgi:hypothetical protein
VNAPRRGVKVIGLQDKTTKKNKAVTPIKDECDKNLLVLKTVAQENDTCLKGRFCQSPT